MGPGQVGGPAGFSCSFEEFLPHQLFNPSRLLQVFLAPGKPLDYRFLLMINLEYEIWRVS